MKILQNKKSCYGWYSERYELNNLKLIPGHSYGADIFFKLINHPEISFGSLSMKGESEEIGAPVDFYTTNNVSEINLIDNIVKIFDSEELEHWRLYCNYKETDIEVSGWTQSKIVTVSYPINKEVNLIPVLEEIEQQIV